jgi:hypothetical protein
MRFILLAMALMVAAPATAQDDDPVLPAWMAGCWETRDGARWAEECWIAPRGGMMIGSGRRGEGDRLVEWEVMRIALSEPHDDGSVLRMAFVAAPGGTGWTTFAWSPGDGDGVAFANVANDYPQLVRYWRKGKNLKARISMADGSRPVEWTYRPMGSGD